MTEPHRPRVKYVIGPDGSPLTIADLPAPGTYTMTATGSDGSGNSVAISTEVQGIVDSVDLTSSPPLLSIGGTTYTTDKIKRVIRPNLGSTPSTST